MMKKKYYQLIQVVFILVLFFNASKAQVSGKIFRDFNANGTFDTTPTYNENGQSGVVVNAYDTVNNSLTVTYTGGGTVTDDSGQYHVAAAMPGQVRLEFVLSDGYTFASNGASGGTSIMFPTTSTQDLAVNTPDDYWDNTNLPNPSLIVPIYTQGTIQSVYKAKPGVIGFKNNAASVDTIYTNTGSNQTFPALTTLVDKVAPYKVEDIGTTWGVAFDKENQLYYLSAFAKRHSGVGPLGFGGVYILKKNADGSYTQQTGFDLEGLTPALGATLELGSITRTNTDNTSDNYIADGAYTPSRDLDAYAKIGKISFGDADYFDQGKKLFVTNLKQSSLLEIDAASSLSGLSGAALAAKIKSYDINTLPNVPTCTGGNLRIWGLKFYKGVGYLGAVCDANISQNSADLKGFVLSFDPNNVAAGFTNVLDINLNYRDGTKDWHPWTNTWVETGRAMPAGGFFYTEPTISDIEFDEKGNMIIALQSLTGHKFGYGNYLPISGTTNIVNPITGGDLLHACYNSASKSWNLEGTGSCAQNFTQTTNMNQGYVASGTAGVGEFFDDISGDGTSETVMGSLAKVMGTNKIISTNIDPFPITQPTTGEGYWATGGITFYDATIGDWSKQARLYEGGWQENYGKANGLGDMELALTPQPIEIGNRVFMDTNKNGFQDAGEMGIDGVVIELWKAGAKVTGTGATTANGGQWYFSNLNADTDYEVKILAANIPSGKELTTANISANAKDLIDNDAVLVGTDAVISYKTGSAGQNNHSLDFGFKVTCTLSATASGTNPTCANNDGTINLTVTNATGTPTYLWSNGAVTEDLAAIPAGQYTVTVTDGTCSTTVTATIDVVPSNIQKQICPGDSYKLEISDNTLTGIQWKKDGIDIAGANSSSYIAASVGVYTYTSNGVGGCAVGQCCPIELVASTNCCKPAICTTVTITKK